MTETVVSPLTGKALLQKVKELAHLKPREKAIRCGYQTTGKNSQTRVNLGAFYEALLQHGASLWVLMAIAMVVGASQPIGSVFTRTAKL